MTRARDISNVITDANLSGTLDATGIVTANAGVKVDNITIDGTEIDLSSGDLTVDVEGDITLDANGGDIKLSDNGTVFAEFTNDSTYLDIKNPNSNQDIMFKGVDDGSTITALQLDMSDGGRAVFNNGISIGGNSAANTLDDYEEGTWSPTLTSSSGASRSVDSQVSRYTKIGRICYVSCQIGTIGALSGSNSGTLRLGGLPFNYNGSVSKSITGDVRFQNVDLPSGIVQTTMIQNSSGTSNLFFFSNTFDLNNAGELGISSIGNTSNIILSLVYEVA